MQFITKGMLYDISLSDITSYDRLKFVETYNLNMKSLLHLWPWVVKIKKKI